MYTLEQFVNWENTTCGNILHKQLKYKELKFSTITQNKGENGREKGTLIDGKVMINLNNNIDVIRFRAADRLAHAVFFTNECFPCTGKK